jgi:hypothetical protein
MAFDCILPFIINRFVRVPGYPWFLRWCKEIIMIEIKGGYKTVMRKTRKRRMPGCRKTVKE